MYGSLLRDRYIILLPTSKITLEDLLYLEVEPEEMQPEISMKQVPLLIQIGHTNNAREIMKKYKVGDVDVTSIPMPWQKEATNNFDWKQLAFLIAALIAVGTFVYFIRDWSQYKIINVQFIFFSKCQILRIASNADKPLMIYWCWLVVMISAWCVPLRLWPIRVNTLERETRKI